MADLSKNLKEYLSRSSNNGATSEPGTTKGKGWFWRRQSTMNGDPIDTGSTWFGQAQSDPLLPSLSRKQRIFGFVICILLGTFCFSLAFLYLPFLLVKARKFAVLYSLGSVFTISSFAMLWGPVNHLKHLFSCSRLPFTAAYFGSMLATLYFSLWVRSTIYTVIFAVVQIFALVWYIVSYIPGGQTGLKFFSNLFYAAASKTVQSTLPI